MIRQLFRRSVATGAAAAAIAAISAAMLGAVPAQASTTSNLFASVNLDGTLAHGHGVTGVTHIGTGRYEVTFSADVRQCACPAASRTRVAVVAADGRISRGSRHTWSFSGAAGQYTLVTSRPVAACAAVATRGSADTAVPFDPATVEIAPGASRHAVGIQVRQLLFFGGTPASESFHAALVC